MKNKTKFGIAALALVLAIGGMAFASTTTQVKDLHGMKIVLDGWTGTAAELDDAMREACLHPTYGYYDNNQINTSAVTWIGYYSNFTDLNNVKMQCKFRAGGGYSVFWTIGYSWGRPAPTYNFNTHTMTQSPYFWEWARFQYQARFYITQP